MSRERLDLSDLRRHPDVEGPDLVAADAADRLILDEAAPLLEAAVPGEVAIVGDSYGALTLGSIDRFDLAGLRLHTDSVVSELALAGNADRLGMTGTYRLAAPGAELLRDASIILLRLPRSLDALEEICQLIGAHAPAGARLVAGGRDKHMNRSMNDLLARYFSHVHASRGRQKSRVLHARDPRAGTARARTPATAAHQPPPGAPLTYPVRRHDADLGIDVIAHGAAFAGPAVDIGTRALLRTRDQWPVTPPPDSGRTALDVVDLGCGTGVLAVVAARQNPAARVIASDASAAAIASARLTADAAGVGERVITVREDALATRADVTADLVLCNPPFHAGHAGAALVPDVALRIFTAAARVLRPGGQLWTVFNSRLGHARTLRRLVGPTEIVADDGRFTVTRTLRRPRR